MKTKTRNITICITAMLLLSTQACDDKEELNLGEPSHSVVVTSEMDFDNKINLNGDITFGDASVGIVSRTWTFPEGVVDIENSDNDVSSAENTVKAYFRKLGDHEVKLNQVFGKDAYVGGELRGKVIDTTILVRVLDNVTVSVRANLVDQDGNPGQALNMANGARNEVMAGSTVRYTVAATGEPENYIWSPEGGDPEMATEFVDEFDVKYKKLGTFDFGFAANRARPEGGAELLYTDLIAIVPSTEPVTLDAVVERNGSIGLNYSREMEPSTLRPEDFTVSITNGGSPISATVSEVTVDPEEGNIVLVSLENDRIYNDDTVTISYTAGTMATTDAVAADGFTDRSIIFVGENLLQGGDFDFSFENSMASNWPYQFWGPPWDGYALEISQNQAQNGSSSALVEMQPNGGMIIGHTDANGDAVPFSAESGKVYEIGVWIYLEAVGVTDAGGFSPDLRFYWFPGTDWGVGPNPEFGPDFPLNEWVYSSILVQFPDTGEYTFNLRGFNENNGTVTRFYMDNISLSEAVVRP